MGLAFTNPGGSWGKWDMCLCFGCGGVGGVGGEWLGSLGHGLEGWGGVKSVSCESELFVLMAGPGICILS